MWVFIEGGRSGCRKEEGSIFKILTKQYSISELGGTLKITGPNFQWKKCQTLGEESHLLRDLEQGGQNHVWNVGLHLAKANHPEQPCYGSSFSAEWRISKDRQHWLWMLVLWNQWASGQGSLHLYCSIPLCIKNDYAELLVHYEDKLIKCEVFSLLLIN